MSPNGNKINRAMILAAGLGTRLRPLTLKIPKPLLPVRGKALIDYNLGLLKKAGVKEVVINLHHLGGQIRRHVGSGRKFGLKVFYSNEPKILGTGGGIKNAEPHLAGLPFVLINADVLVKIDLKKVVAAFFRKNCAALMVVRRLKKGEDYAGIKVTRDGRLVSFGGGRFMYTGISVFDPVIFKFLKKPSCLIEGGFKKLLSAGLPVQTFVHGGYWNDVGTMERYGHL